MELRWTECNIPVLVTSHLTKIAEGESGFLERLACASSTKRTVSCPCAGVRSTMLIRTPFLARATASARPEEADEVPHLLIRGLL